MRKKIRISFFIVLALSILAFFFFRTETAAAQTIEVDFESDPLFGEADILPGDTISREFVVTNVSDDVQTAYVSTINVGDASNLAYALLVVIAERSGRIVYSGALSDLFSRGLVELGEVAAGRSAAYNFSVSFSENAGNVYQNGSIGFDLCVGFDGGNESCINGADSGNGLDDANDTDNTQSQFQSGLRTNNLQTTTTAPPLALDPTLRGGDALTTQGADGSFEDTQGGGETRDETEIPQDNEETERETQAAAAVLGFSNGANKAILWVSYGLLFILTLTLSRTLLR